MNCAVGRPFYSKRKRRRGVKCALGPPSFPSHGLLSLFLFFFLPQVALFPLLCVSFSRSVFLCLLLLCLRSIFRSLLFLANPWSVFYFSSLVPPLPFRSVVCFLLLLSGIVSFPPSLSLFIFSNPPPRYTMYASVCCSLGGVAFSREERKNMQNKKKSKGKRQPLLSVQAPVCFSLPWLRASPAAFHSLGSVQTCAAVGAETQGMTVSTSATCAFGVQCCTMCAWCCAPTGGRSSLLSAISASHHERYQYAAALLNPERSYEPNDDDLCGQPLKAGSP